jgi:glutathione S-transferase
LVRGDIVIKVYDNAFSPFARKVRMVLEFKGLDFDAVDGLLETDHEALKRRERAHQDASSDRR